MADIHWTEIVFGIGTFLVLTTYHVHWLFQVRKAPFQTYLGVTRHLRHMWVESIIADRRDILSVQSLRNWIMASSFLASTAMIIVLGIMGFLFKAENVSEIPFDTTLIFSHMKSLFAIKLLVLIVHFFFAFFSFTLSIRYMNQVSFMINIPIQSTQISSEFIAHTLDLGMLHYTIGMRAYYLAIVVVLWLFGPAWMFLGSLVLSFVLYKLDHCCALDYSTARQKMGTGWESENSHALRNKPVLR